MPTPARYLPPARTMREEEEEDALSWWNQHIIQYPLLTPGEEKALAVRVRAGDKEALLRFFHCNLRLVVSHARRYIGRGVPILDLIQEGNLGLLKVIPKYDPDKGTRFSTYASWWIAQAMQRALVRYGRTIRLPDYVDTAMNKVRNALPEAWQEEEAEVKVTPALLERLGMAEDWMTRFSALPQATISLNLPTDTEHTWTELGDLIEDPAPLPEDQIAPLDDSVQVRDLLRAARLIGRERQVIVLRFGLGGEEPHTLEEAGKVLGITRERVRQIEQRALLKLRWAARGQQDELAAF